VRKLSIIIPVYNEERTIALIIDKIKKVDIGSGWEKEIIIVNDSSTDKSSQIIEEIVSREVDIDFLVQNQPINQGKGAAIRKGIQSSTGDVVIIQDADLEYDPEDYKNLLSQLDKSKADVVYGSRFLEDPWYRPMTSFHTGVNRFLTSLSNLFTGFSLTDMETCYKLINGNIARSLQLQESRFGIEPEITSKLAKINDINITEVQISYDRRTYDAGKKIGWKDGVRPIYCILKYR